MATHQPNKPGRSAKPNVKRIVEWRVLKGWTQADLAARAGVSKRTIENLERGNPVNLQTIADVAEALGGEVAEIIMSLGRSSPTPAATPESSVAWSEDDELFEREYREAAFNELNRVELIGADIEHDVRCSELLQAFVMLNLNHQESEVQSDAEFDEASQTETDNELVSARTALNQLLSDGNCGRLLIRGSAGTGKTTLVKWAAITALKSWFNRNVHPQIAHPIFAIENQVIVAPKPNRVFAAWDDIRSTAEASFINLSPRGVVSVWPFRTPLIVFLRNYDGEIPPVEEFTRFAGKMIAPQPARWVERVLRVGRGLVFLDGIDEVPMFHRERLKGQIKTLVETYPNNYFVLTTRPQAVRPGWLEPLGFGEAEIAPMSIPDRDLFIRRWYKAVAEYADMGARKKAQMPQIAEDLIAKLADAPGLTEVTANPLFCGVTCALFYERREVPENIAKLCEQLCWMLHKRERPEGEKWWEKFPAAYVKVNYDQKKFLNGQLAVAAVESDQSTIPVPQAREVIREALKRIPGADAGDARDVLDGLHERYGLLREAAPERDDQPKTLTFVHNTFKEFLAGSRIAAEGNPKPLLNHADSETWQRAALFALATTDSVAFKNEFLGAFLKTLPDPLPEEWRPEDRRMRDRALFALRCWKLTTGCAPDILTRVANLVPQLLPPRATADAEWLAAAGNDIVDRLKRTPGLDDVQAAACVRTLRLINTRDARAALDAYRDEKRWGVLAELAPVFNPLTLPAVMGYLHEGEHSLPEGVAREVSDLGPLAGKTGLLGLWLRGTSVSDLSPLSGLTGLRTLELIDTPVSDVGPLSGLTGLRELWLRGTSVSDVGPLSGLTGLRTLSLFGTSVSDVGPLSGLTGLRRLDLAKTPVSDLGPLSGLTGLRELWLRGTSVSDLSPLSGLKKLEHIDIRTTRVKDVTQLAHLKMLLIDR
ncbi:Internalin-A precursor [Gemmata sp. SH-PL17]|uniref:NACHT domain-containing protein n=1 Tax=Gemmata sp. SH-PL17 TaxID=1630693 RepID=UPI00078B399D|nr:leucine-rich repeat domain-containing protein [Gemmata sp. SH-PL17]AMV24056.1 Internalin-A precursor [Gemmata sp. SH-PL17]